MFSTSPTQASLGSSTQGRTPVLLWKGNGSMLPWGDGWTTLAKIRVFQSQRQWIPRELGNRNCSRTSCLTFLLLSLLPSLHSFLLSFFLIISILFLFIYLFIIISILFIYFFIIILITVLTFLCKMTNYRVLLELLEFDKTGHLQVIWKIWWLLSVSIKIKNWKAKLIFLNSVWYKNISSSLLEGSFENSALSHSKCCPPVDTCGHYNLWMRLQEKSCLVTRYWTSSAKRALFVFF